MAGLVRLVHLLSVWFGGLAGTAARVALTAIALR